MTQERSELNAIEDHSVEQMTEENLTTESETLGEASTEESTTPRKKVAWLRWLVMTAIVVFLSWLTYSVNQENQYLRSKINTLESSLVDVQSRLSALSSSYQTQEKSAEEKIKALDKQLQKISGAQKHAETNIQQMINELAARVNERKGDVEDTRRLLQVDALIVLAEQQWLLTRESSRVMSLLIAADKQLAKMTDPRILPVRKAIMQDLLVLKPLAKMSTLNLYIKVTSWNQLVEKLRLNTVITTNQVNHSHSEESTKITGIGSVLKKWFKVVEHKKVPLPPLSLEEEWLLRQTLKLKLVTLQWFLLAGESEGAVRLLSEIEQWLEEMTIDNEDRAIFMAEITELKAALLKKPLVSVELLTPKAWRTAKTAWQGEISL